MCRYWGEGPISGERGDVEGGHVAPDGSLPADAARKGGSGGREEDPTAPQGGMQDTTEKTGGAVSPATHGGAASPGPAGSTLTYGTEYSDLTARPTKASVQLGDATDTPYG